jgi:uncharacterized GH25 family protein
MKRFVKPAAIALALTLPFAAHAHRAWILPAATVLSSEEPWVTFDAAISNDIFHTDYHAMRLDGVKALAPDGKEIPLQNGASGKYRSTFDLQLQQKGTYKVFSASSGLNATWEENGQRKFWPPRGAPFTQEGFEKEVPKKADNLRVTQSSRRQETFVTAGNPTDTVLKTTGKGLELMPVTHPNDLFAKEPAEFQLLIDGAPATGAKVTVLPGGMRYRDGQEAIEAVADAQGKFSITWPHAGQYYLEAGYQDDKAAKPATQRRGSYVATFEVLPQ